MMRHAADADGRYPLSTREYEALRTLFGAVNAMALDMLKDRCDLNPGDWEKLQEARDSAQQVLNNILRTIPLKKLMSISTELRNTICELRIKPPVSASNGSIYIDQAAMVRMAERAIAMDCVICEKTREEGKRCPLYRDINDCFPYELMEPDDALCPFAGISRLRLEDKKE